ncbi:MAG: hypothetical protein HZC55_11485 [Verrucomicrobia bacterium]|nr:hypothetical protein [Verrucomicrobiota bacterium]
MPLTSGRTTGIERHPKGAWLRQAWTRVAGGSAGEVAAASLAICALSGIALHSAYDARRAPATIALWLLGDPLLLLARNLHAWSALTATVATAWFTWRRLLPENGIRPGSALRAVLVLAVPLAVLLQLSGFLLRGDADAQASLPLATQLIAELPVVGPPVAARWRDSVEDLTPVLLGHVWGGVILVGIGLAATARPHRPRLTPLISTGALTLLVAMLLSPGLNDGLDGTVSGPWVLAGVGAFLHLVPSTFLAVTLGLAFLWCWWALPRFADRTQARVRGTLLGLAAGLLALVIWGTVAPGPPDTRRWRWPVDRGDWRPGLIAATFRAEAPNPRGVPEARGRPEGCLVCHSRVAGLGVSHRPEAIGCAVCHAGDTTSLDPERAHASLIRVPGNLADAPRTCGTTGCHPEVVRRVDRSIMATFSGVIEVNRRIFGETSTPDDSVPHVQRLGHSAADSHLRQLCVSCHLGQDKVTWGPITQESRGGGCNACHLVYSPAAQQALDRFESAPAGQRQASLPGEHPSLILNPENGHCFGCHSRSGRISTSYEGWHELREPPSAAALGRDSSVSPRFRLLDDGRHFIRVSPDVHHVRGLDCIDCHTPTEVMGSGRMVRRKSQWSLPPGFRLGSTQAGSALNNVVVAPDGTGQLRRKRTGDFLPLRAPSGACRAGKGHDRLSCASCHTAWAPRCVTCHTQFDPTQTGFDHLSQQEVRGSWVESSGPFEAAPPTLGIRRMTGDPASPAEIVDTFVPGMILELDRNREAGAPRDLIFQRLYAHTAAHTISRESRSCQSCHNDPAALGYGQGDLRLDLTSGAARWSFSPANARTAHDQLPGDAWTGFLQTRTGLVSTRDDVRPFNAAEQRRILTVGACLTCHDGSSNLMQEAIADFATVLGRRTSSCRVPSWPD